MSMVAKLKKKIQGQAEEAIEVTSFRIPAMLNGRLTVVAEKLGVSKNWLFVNTLEQLCEDFDADQKAQKPKKE
jgi:predicted DNA-binding protein